MLRAGRTTYEDDSNDSVPDALSIKPCGRRRLFGGGLPKRSPGQAVRSRLDDSRAPLYRWFSGGELNTCYNAIGLSRREWPRLATGRHLRKPGDGDKAYRLTAIYGSSCAIRRLCRSGVVKGDRVVIYMPMMPRRSSPCMPVHE